MSDTLWQLPATELARRYRDGSLTPLDAARASLARLEAVNPTLNAVVLRRDVDCLREAEAATRRFAAGQPLSAIDGIPLTVKDSLYTADMPTSWGCRALAARGTGEDEFAIRALLEAYGKNDSLGYFATRRDKSVVFAPNGRAAITYRVEVGVCLASGDPVGDPQAWPQAISGWLALCQEYGWAPGVMGASSTAAEVFREAGLSALRRKLPDAASASMI